MTVTTVGYGDKAPRGGLGRLFGLFWMVTGIFIFANFTATISSSLSVMHTNQKINGPSDLLDKIVVSPKGSVAIPFAEQHGWKHKQVDTQEEAYSILEKGGQMLWYLIRRPCIIMPPAKDTPISVISGSSMFLFSVLEGLNSSLNIFSNIILTASVGAINL